LSDIDCRGEAYPLVYLTNDQISSLIGISVSVSRDLLDFIVRNTSKSVRESLLLAMVTATATSDTTE
jgi:hypothetical protein